MELIGLDGLDGWFGLARLEINWMVEI